MKTGQLRNLQTRNDVSWTEFHELAEKLRRNLTVGTLELVKLCQLWKSKPSAMAADEPRVVLAQKLHADKSISADDICQTLKISRSTLYRYLRMSKKTTHES